MLVGFIFLALIVIIIAIGFHLALGGSSIPCPKCKGYSIISDQYRYKGVICHQCKSCGTTFETSR